LLSQTEIHLCGESRHQHHTPTLALADKLEAHVGGNYSVVELDVAPLGGPGMHIHENGDEIIVVLECSLRCICDEEQFDAAAGTIFVVPRGAPRAWIKSPRDDLTLVDVHSSIALAHRHISQRADRNSRSG
jgi:mannose-6-phosphate isomerase-like protein (cupin superfamily)